MPSQQPVDGRHNADAFTVNLIIMGDGKSNESQLVTTQDRRGSDERIGLSLESFFSFYIVGYLNEFHSLVLIAYNEVDFLRTRTLLVIINIQKRVRASAQKFNVNDIFQAPPNVLCSKGIVTIVLKTRIYDISLGISDALLTLEGMLGCACGQCPGLP